MDHIDIAEIIAETPMTANDRNRLVRAIASKLPVTEASDFNRIALDEESI